MSCVILYRWQPVDLRLISVPELLHEAFVEDHQHLTRGLNAIREALGSREASRVVELARQLDRQVGAHIEFEENVLYPELEQVLGHEFVERLYQEHARGQRALQELVTLDPDERLEPARRDALSRKVEAALEHALSCGTLLSHVDAMDVQRRDELLKALLALRQHHRRWTELEGREARAAGRNA